MTFPQTNPTPLPPNTIVPGLDTDRFVPYLNRLYEDISFAVNSKDSSAFVAAISNVASSIPNLPNFGGYIICVSGTASQQPTLTAALSKSDAGAIGVITPLNFQAGTGTTWAGVTLTITSTATNFQIAHSLAGNVSNFSIRIIGTQG